MNNKVKRRPKGYWTRERIQKEASKYTKRKYFEKGSNSAYQIAIRLGIIDIVCVHMDPSQSEAYTVEDIRLAANKYTKRNDFKKGSRGEYSAACRKGKEFLNSVCRHMDPPITMAYSKEELQLEANKYKKRGDFYLGSLGAYAVAQRRPDFDEICAHMDPPSNEPYSLEEIQIEANKYLTPAEFVANSPGAYHAAVKRDDYKKICKHMTFSGCSSLLEKELLGIIQLTFPNARKIMDKKVKIIDKPYIKGFEIDIFISELNRGIEFDGTYHHSFNTMRKDKRKVKWTDEDIRNYHKIKDDWFLSKNINILHIKEEDWKKDRQICIDLCLSFLAI